MGILPPQDFSRSHLFRVYSALAAVQVILCIGAAYLKLSLSRATADDSPFPPVIFALFREAIAAVPLLALSRSLGGTWFPGRSKVDAFRFALLGFFLFVNQLFFLYGVDLSGVVVATCMQPSIPVFTAGFALVLRMEPYSSTKVFGIFLAAAGATCMVLGSSSGAQGSGDSLRGWRGAVGCACLVINCASMAGYYLVAKRLLARFHSSTVTAWAYVVAAACMLSVALATVPRGRWALPSQAVGPLLYWALVCSVLGYLTITWAASRLPASRVAAFQCLQPIAGTLIGWAALGERLTPWDLGAAGIVGGLALVVRAEEPSAAAAAAGDKDALLPSGRVCDTPD
uniref:WAT1-related protein n=1 Tax=Tetraselmis sp. GSL018 TaxID=582737 RepID=A0A061RX60_9CHLO|mmetsp:Transcript_29976/g.71403  ORF Transcript_29976/g.71403 Transcript_29976/m.71403 type:complete len:342 (-) Transcript_29976:95-1120(-)